MKLIKSSHLSLACVVGLIALASTSAYSQEAVRSLREGIRSAESKQKANQAGLYNRQAGPLEYRLSSGVHFEYNDNVSLSGANQEDFIITPGINIDSRLPVSELNDIRIQLGLGYRAYIDNSTLNHLTITPGSEFSFDIFVGDNLTINIHDRVSYIQSALDNPQIAGVADFGRIQNTAGIQFDYDMGDVDFALGYDHYNYISVPSAFRPLNRSAERIFGRLGMEVQPATILGVEAGFTLSQYQLNVLNDSKSFSVGPFVDWQMSENFRFQGGVGLTRRDHDAPAVVVPGITGDTEDVTAVYGYADITHTLSERFSHALGFSQFVEDGTSANFVELTRLSETMVYRLTDRATLNVPLSFVYGSESGPAAQREEFTATTLGGNLTFQLSDNLTASGGYNYTWRNSTNIPRLDRDYQLNQVFLNFDWQF